MTAKKCIIIHGCPSDIEKAMNQETRTYDKHWIPWTKKQLVENGIETETPLMPSPGILIMKNSKKNSKNMMLTKTQF